VQVKGQGVQAVGAVIGILVDVVKVGRAVVKEGVGVKGLEERDNA